MSSLGSNEKAAVTGDMVQVRRLDADLATTDMTSRDQHRRRLLYNIVLTALLLGLVHICNTPLWRLSSLNVFRSDIDRIDVNDNNIKLDSPDIFDWKTHPPSKALNWTECYGRFQCARLTVPLLYSEPSGDEGAIALIRSPSKYPQSHEKYRGPVLFNPGGPGDSGIQLILFLERAFRTILSDGFDLVGFDPRGVGFTTPALSVFEDQVEGGTFYLQFPTHVDTWPSTLGESYARARVLANLVEDRAQFIAEHVSTPLMARDMLSIVDASGQDQLQYWGFSYGTVLGATFSAMFPDKIGRIVLDGVLDMEDYYNGTWAKNLQDADAVLADIYQACVVAGPSRCPIYENSTSLIQARVDHLLESLKSTPLAYYDHLDGTWEILDYGLARNIIFTTLYRTHSDGARLTRALAALERGDPSELYMLSLRRLFNALAQCNCPNPGEAPVRFGGAYEIMYAIQCGDAVDREEDLEGLHTAYDKMAKESTFAATWPARVFCSAWKLRSKERFKGSFERNTSHPLLLIGNRADPVTPLANAHKLSKSFRDSVVLTQNASGHCSASATSLCTMKAVREYFIHGTLPEKNTVCETESSIFSDKQPNLDALSMEDRELLEASRMLQEHHFLSPSLLKGGYLNSLNLL
ncbi:hypothetical protein ACEPAG_1731 [Sanghuangporus baumii]